MRHVCETQYVMDYNFTAIITTCILTSRSRASTSRAHPRMIMCGSLAAVVSDLRDRCSRKNHYCTCIIIYLYTVYIVRIMRDSRLYTARPFRTSFFCLQPVCHLLPNQRSEERWMFSAATVCFLCVCGFVCLFINTITSDRVNILMKLRGRRILQKNLGRVRIWGS